MHRLFRIALLAAPGPLFWASAFADVPAETKGLPQAVQDTLARNFASAVVTKIVRDDNRNEAVYFTITLRAKGTARTVTLRDTGEIAGAER